MISTPRWWLLVLLLGLTAACGGSDSDSDPTDGDGTGQDDPNDPDDENPDDPPPDGSLKLGDLCDKDDSCNAGLCVKIGSGKNEGLCSKRCEEETDCDTDGWTCRDILAGSGDEIRGCAPKTLCIDNDADGYGIGPECKGTDCDDDDPSVYQGAPEICDGKDNSCDGHIDNSPVDVGRNCLTGLEGVCADGITVCEEGILQCNALQQPSQEICDGLDNDCDGLVDEGVQDDENGNYVEQIGRACAPDGSSCQNGVYVCDAQGHGGLFCDGLGDDAPEICDGIDNNCNGQIDEGIEGLGDICEVGFGLCVNASAKVCDPEDPNAPPICDVEPKWENQTDEVCDYIDNNCDGEIDEPFKNEDGVYHTLEHCGGCDVDCNVQWGASGDPSAVHAKPTCEVEAHAARCGFGCTDGYVDMDGIVENGCELLPDAQAIYVTTPAKGGADNNSCGNYDTPCATITRGIARAKSADRSKVRVSEGVFREGIVLENGISVLGGHSSINWLRDTTVNSTVIYGASSAFSEDAVAVVARNITQATEISGFTITAPDADANGNSIALFIEDSNDKFVAKDNTLQAGFGGSGTTGAAGADGTNGAGGSAGREGSHRTTCSQSDWLQGANGGNTTCEGTSTSGGKGGGSSCPVFNEDYDATLKAKAGQNNTGSTGTPGKSARSARYSTTGTCNIASGGAENNNGTDGTEGRDGSNGAGGQGASAGAGTLLSNKMWRGNKGNAGSEGTHGGGGGGGGASRGLAWHNTSRFGIAPTGGGGGAGGCGGKSAQGGGAGGGSFALYIIGSSSNTPTIHDNTLARGVGGVGGAGGLGGSGGVGGAGGHGGEATYGSGAIGNGCAKTGRRGGDGGRGGQGGGGGGGQGGNSFDIATRGLSASAQTNLTSQNNFMIEASENTAGEGGEGGPSIGNDGTSGSAGNFGKTMDLP